MDRQRQIKASIHSFESFGTKDGPGIRFVLFLQGCPLRCLYCHNPDTWNRGLAKYEMSVSEVFSEIIKVKSFIKKGGVTVSGGEPLLQSEFVNELFYLCKTEGVHTALDTSGIIFNQNIEKLLSNTDLVLLDIKHINSIKYKALTSQDLEPTLRFMEYLHKINKPIWVRYVLVPGYTDEESDLHQWAQYVSNYKNVERVDILPFHQMGMHKWKESNLNYQLEKVPSPSAEEILKAENIFRSYGLNT